MSFDNVVDYGNLLRAGNKCCLNGRWKPSVQIFEMTLLRKTSRNKSRLLKRTYRPRKTHNFKIKERGKVRVIKAHAIEDREVYKSFSHNEFKPMFASRVVDNNAASQPGKGTEYSIKGFRNGISKAYRKWGKDFYVVVFDYSDYFGSMNHETVKNKLYGLDEGSKWLIGQYIDLFPGNCGIGIGGEPSQDISVVFPSSLDRMLMCDRRVLDSGRYMDDGYAICHTKEDARSVLSDIRKMSDKLRLTLNEKRTRIFWMKKDSVVWLKKRTFISDTGKIYMEITNRNVRDEIRRIKKQKELIDEGLMPRFVADISIECWCAYAKNYNSYNKMWRVVDFYSETFGVPWSECKVLLRRTHKGWRKKIY